MICVCMHGSDFVYVCEYHRLPYYRPLSTMLELGSMDQNLTTHVQLHRLLDDYLQSSTTCLWKVEVSAWFLEFGIYLLRC